MYLHRRCLNSPEIPTVGLEFNNVVTITGSHRRSSTKKDALKEFLKIHRRAPRSLFIIKLQA